MYKSVEKILIRKVELILSKISESLHCSLYNMYVSGYIFKRVLQTFANYQRHMAQWLTALVRPWSRYLITCGQPLLSAL